MILQTKSELGYMNPLGLWSKIFALALDILIVGAEHATYAMFMRKNGKTKTLTHMYEKETILKPHQHQCDKFLFSNKMVSYCQTKHITKMYYQLADTMAKCT